MFDMAISIQAHQKQQYKGTCITPCFSYIKTALYSYIFTSLSYPIPGVNALWPATPIATAAVEMLGGSDLINASRKTSIMADAAYAILCRDPKITTGTVVILLATNLKIKYQKWQSF